jgi:hypothetical protein
LEKFSAYVAATRRRRDARTTVNRLEHRCIAAVEAAEASSQRRRDLSIAVTSLERCTLGHERDATTPTFADERFPRAHLLRGAAIRK